MATVSGSEKAQKGPAEAFTRLRTDHEQFLETYEKPTQIYRFLRARHALKPLFLHRNLSYMQRPSPPRPSRKRQRKLRLNDLLSHTKEKPDLASQIKSDNHLKISFYGLEQGIDFQKLLANGGWSRKSQRSSGLGDSHMMDVEVLLYKFSQPLAEAVMSNPTTFPSRCTSLGKLVLNYNLASDTSAANVSAKLSKGGPSQVLTVPESRLNAGADGGGTQMLVFRASPHDEPSGEKKRGLARKINRRKTLSSVSVELNRLNHSEIATQIAKAKLHSQSQSQSSQVSQNSDGHCRPSVSPSLVPAAQMDMDPEQFTSSIASNSISSPDSVTPLEEPHVATSSSPMNLGATQRRTKSKSKKEKKDACVMTDLSYGTEIYSTLSLPLPSSSPSTPTRPIGTFSSKLPKNNSLPPLDLLSSALPSIPPRKGFTDKCTSPLIPKLQFKDNLSSLNGLSFLNGSASVEEIEAATTGGVKLKLHRSSSKAAIDDDTGPYLAQHPPDSNGLYGEEIESGKMVESPCSIDTSPGVSSEVQSLIVSIPRTLYQSSRRSSISSVYSDCSPGATPIGKKYLPGHHGRRRSEIQLLLDGDKRRANRIGSKEIPVVKAEDISSRATRSTSSQPRGPWLSSTTRKVTPVEHFGCPISPNSLRRVSIPASPTSLLNSSSRKRRLSESSSPAVASPSLPPPAKLPKIESDKNETPPVSPSPPSTPVPPSQNDNISPMETESPSPSSSPTLAEWQTVELNPKDDRSSSLPEPTRTRDMFGAELVVYDSRGDCLLENGVYSLLMQRCQKKEGGSSSSAGLVTFLPLTWNSIFGSGTENKGSTEGNKPGSVLLKFSLQWTKGPPKFRIASCLETALDLEKLRKAYYPPLSPSPPPPTIPPTSPPNQPPPLPNPAVHKPEAFTGEVMTTNGYSSLDPPEDCDTVTNDTLAPLVPDSLPSRARTFLNFLYNSSTLQQTELRGTLCCPWCSLACGRPYSLLKHLSLCHPRFLYTYTPVEGAMAIDVHVNKLYDAGTSTPDPGMRHHLSIVQKRKGPSKCLPCTVLIVERHTDVEEDLSEFLNDGTWKRGYNSNRLYYHSRSCLPMLPDEVAMDSEQEEETLHWQKLCSQKMIEDFTDVNGGEKELMKLWNNFAMEERLIANKQLPDACVKFATENRQLLHEKNIVHNFMTHLISLCDYGVISPGVFRSTMLSVYGDS